ncbi:Imm49 family immunity protein [Mucilaginibacter boryungensis]|uniref:Immunity 49 family protein n=1 Tax=Mucilaginibacter boryungensis TaxID=768480 RepID=A0ABR9XM79_9SPHI|nr:Imm49 family immunity protein [Mucilaginibacter boryungensis]MBE9668317.1 immunity 49 family protein [Mucilaginibacter boryungensis]
MDKLEHLKISYANRINNERIGLNKLSNNEDPYYIIPFFEGDNVVYALYAMYIEHDFAKARSCFYKAARIREFMTITYDRRFMDTGIYDLANAFLSDNSAIINRVCHLRNKVINETDMGYQICNAAQNILLNNFDELDLNIGRIERFLKLPRFAPLAGLKDYFKGFLQNDKDKITQGLNDLLAARKKRNIDPLISKFFSTDTAGYCKLAWLKGYEIDLQSPFVPVELMRIEPLKYYEDYDFLNATS